MTDNDDNDKRGGDRPPHSAPRGDRPTGDRPFKPRGDRPSGDRPPRDGDRPPHSAPRGDRPTGDRPFKPRGDRPSGDRPPRDGDRPFKPRGDRPFGDRPPRDGDRPFKPRGDRPFGDRPPRDGDRPFKPRGDRPSGDRPPRDGDRPFKPRGDRPFGDRPPRDGDRPFKPRGDRPFGDRPPRDGDRPFKPRGDRPQRDGERRPFTPREPAVAREADDGTNRIAKVIARAGLCSRRDAEAWIMDGRVSVNGAVLDSPALDVADTDVITVDGKPLPQRERTRLWLYHKPKGLETTEHSPEGRPTVFDNLPEGLPRVMSVGRLDINTEGLLLLTNDGGLARVLAHPKTAWLRRYRVRVYGPVNQAQLDTLRQGITIEDPEEGEVTYAPIVATLERSRGDNSWLSMDLREGKNREIKKVLEHFGLQVTRLIRVSFGPFQLGELPEGTAEEIKGRYLRDQLGERLAEEAGADFDSPVFTHLEQVLEPVKSQRGSRIQPQDRDGRARFASSEEELPKRRFDPKKPGEKRDAALLGKREDLKVTREKVADRKGREVKVDRITTLPREEDEFPRARFSREQMADPNRSFRKDRGDRPAGDRSSGDRPFTPRGDRPPRDGDRPFRPREDGDRPRNFKPRDGGDRPFTPRGDRPSGDRPPRDGDRPFRPREDGDRPRNFKPRDGGDRPFTPRGDRPPRDGDRPFRPREDGDRPRSFKPRDGGDRPFTPRGDRPSGDRPPRDGDRPFKPRAGGKPGGGFGGRPGAGPRGPRPGGSGPGRGGPGRGGPGGKGADRRR